MTEKKIPGQVSGGERSFDDDDPRGKPKVLEKSGIERMDAEGGAQETPRRPGYVPDDVKAHADTKRAIEKHDPKP